MFEWYHYIAISFILAELLFLLQMLHNYHLVVTKSVKRRDTFRPRTAIIVPCKGIDPEFDANIASFYTQNYNNYILMFVVESAADPAYQRLLAVRDRLKSSARADDIQILIAEKAAASSQKIHNLLYCYRHLPADIEIMAFADSDACVRKDWLSHIVYPLHKEETGIATGYRWYVPQTNNLATLTLSALNAKIAQLLGNYRYNLAWGGSMAIRVELFRTLDVEKIWRESISDDLILSVMVRRAGKKIIFVPACLVASYERTTFKNLLEFGTRQFIITRVSTTYAWPFALFASLFSVTGLFGGLAAAIYAFYSHLAYPWIIAAVPLTCKSCHVLLAWLRQDMIYKLLPAERTALKAARTFDQCFSCLVSLLLLFIILSSAFKRQITWRGITYKLLGPTKTVVVSRGANRC